MSRKINNILVTGGAGFIGSNFIRYLFEKTTFQGNVLNYDKLTYAGDLSRLNDIDRKYGGKRYVFEKGDICNYDQVKRLCEKYEIGTIVHFAAESHVDRSINTPHDFIQTNIVGTFTLLEVARDLWNHRNDVLFHHISTDEVYGSLGESGCFYEENAYKPNSPYSASKASSDHLVRAYNQTYNLPVTVSNCSNNYGPYQFPEKLIPLMITNMKEGKPLPVYGKGANIRDWLHVDDHNSAIWLILNKGMVGETYNIGGENEWKNLDLVNLLCEKMSLKTDKPQDYYKKLITFVTDRLGHDKRYSVNCDKIKNELGWDQNVKFDGGIEETILWYLENDDWVKNVRK